jgi:hypothetical protein
LKTQQTNKTGAHRQHRKIGKSNPYNNQIIGPQPENSSPLAIFTALPAR